jgi:hypothetical protein
MMQIRKITSTALVLTLLSAQVFLPMQVFAEDLNYDNPNSGSNPFKPNFNSIVTSGLLTSLVGCTGIVNKVSKVTTEYIQYLTKTKAEKKALEAALKAKAATAVPSVDEKTALEQYKAKIKEEEGAKAAAFREECINGIAVTLAKNQLTSFTKHTMNWISTGFNGDPMFVRDVDSFMNSISTQILEKQNELFKDPANKEAYPFGRDFARSQVQSYKAIQNPEDALRSDIKNYLSPGATTESFGRDFRQGGWDGWLALTQHPQNNPLGFTMEAKEVLTKKQETAATIQQKELDQNGGFLSQKKCAVYALSKSSAKAKEKVEQRNKAIAAANAAKIRADNAKKRADASANDAALANEALITAKLWAQLAADAARLSEEAARESEKAAAEVKNPQCDEWEIVTPGSVIKDKVSTYINSPERQLELAKTVNDSLNAVFSALINKFQNQGLSSLGSRVNTFTSSSGGPGVNQIFDSFGNSVNTSTGGGTTGIDGFFDLTRNLGNQYISPVNEGSWNAQTNTPALTQGTGLRNHYYTVSVGGNTALFPGGYVWKKDDKAFFDGETWRVGLPKYAISKKGVLQLQYDFIDKAQEAMGVSSDVVPALGRLDYCIPGPNPNWQSTASNTLSSFIGAQTGNENIQELFDEYNQKVLAFYGPSSPMQTSGNSDYLAMASLGLNMTKDIASYDEIMDEKRIEYQQAISSTQATIEKLNVIKDKVNVIITASQKRRDARRAQEGKTKVTAMCIATEKVTYLDGDVLK